MDIADYIFIAVLEYVGCSSAGLMACIPLYAYGVLGDRAVALIVFGNPLWVIGATVSYLATRAMNGGVWTHKMRFFALLLSGCFWPAWLVSIGLVWLVKNWNKPARW